MRLTALAPSLALAFAVAGCGTREVVKPDAHIQPEARSTASIPPPVRAVPLPPAPLAREAELRYSVVVAQQPVRDVLLAMARETKINFDIHPGIEGTVNLNAIDQTLKQILTRMSRQVDMRWEQDGQTITVMPDTPFLRNYRVDYVNMSRDVTGTIGVQSNVVTPPSATTGTGTQSQSASQNSSLLKVDNSAKNRFWETLEKNVKDMLRETDKLLPEGSSETFVQSRGQQANTPAGTPRTPAQRRARPNQATAAPGAVAEPANQESEFVEQRLTFREAAAVIVNPETGIVSVRATSRQHEKVAEFIAQVMGAARRQVLIEATVVEVLLNDNYQSGVDWSALGNAGLGYGFRQNLIGNNLADPPFFAVTYNDPDTSIFGTRGSLTSTVKLLSSFGNTRVLSSPKIMAVNNQTAVLKVVDNRVYFTVQAQVTPGTNNSAPIVAFTTTQNVVPVGFVMNVTPQISDNDVVVLNVRPTVSRILGFVLDPNPDLARANVTNRVPEIQSREFESVLRVPSGHTAILGGLMQDSFEGQRDGLPILSRIPVFGDAVSYRNDTARKSELVIFLRPIVVRDASVDGDLAEYRRYLPDRDFFQDARNPVPEVERRLQRLEREGLRGMELAPVPVVPEPPPPGGAP